MNLVILAIGAAVIAASGFLAGDKWRAGIVAARDLKAVQDVARVQILRADRADQAAERHERTKAEVQVVYETITKEVQHVVEKPVYRQVCLDDDGLEILRRAISATADGTRIEGSPAIAPRVAASRPAGASE